MCAQFEVMLKQQIHHRHPQTHRSKQLLPQWLQHNSINFNSSSCLDFIITNNNSISISIMLIAEDWVALLLLDVCCRRYLDWVDLQWWLVILFYSYINFKILICPQGLLAIILGTYLLYDHQCATYVTTSVTTADLRLWKNEKVVAASSKIKYF